MQVRVYDPSMSLDIDPLDSDARDAARALTAREERAAAELEQGDIRWLMKHKEGRRLVFRLLGMCGIYQLSYRGDGAERTAYREGRRSVGLEALAQVSTLAPDAHIKMLLESKGK